MKKVLISIGSLLIMAAIVVLFVNANGSKKDGKKAKAAVEASASCCSKTATTEATAAVDHSNCPDMKDGKCDPATCTAHKDAEKKEAAECAPTAGCEATCPMKTAAIK
jgi:hypothetical protein